MEDLATENARMLMAQPLWMQMDMPDTLPHWAKEEFAAFNHSELAKTTSFGLITDWYRAVLRGGPSPFDEKAEIAIAQMSPKDWGDGDDPRDCIAVMDRAAKIAGWRRGDDGVVGNGGQGDDTPPQLPVVEAASLEPEWQEGKLSLPATPATSDLVGADIEAALRGLKGAIGELANEIRTIPNVDGRFTTYLDDLVVKLPDTMPPQDELFLIAHNADVLEGYMVTANAEWPVIQASKLGALSLQFSRTMDKIPAWRAFKKKPTMDELAHDDVSLARTLAEALAKHLEDEYATAFATSDLPNSVERLSDEMENQSETSVDQVGVSQAQASRVQDLLESSSNILKRIVEMGMVTLGKGYEVVKASGSSFVKGAVDQNLKEAEKAGQSVVKWLYRAVKGAVVGGVGTAGAANTGLLGWAAENFPTVFGWLEKFIPFFIV